MGFLKRFLLEAEGADAAEYAIVIALVALGIVVGAIALGGQLGNAFSHNSQCFQTELTNRTPC